MEPTATSGATTGEIAGMLDVGDVGIAYRHRNGSAPGLMWLGGYRSDMNGTKAQVLAALAASHDLSTLR